MSLSLHTALVGQLPLCLVSKDIAQYPNIIVLSLHTVMWPVTPVSGSLRHHTNSENYNFEFACSIWWPDTSVSGSFRHRTNSENYHVEFAYIMRKLRRGASGSFKHSINRSSACLTCIVIYDEGATPDVQFLETFGKQINYVVGLYCNLQCRGDARRQIP